MIEFINEPQFYAVMLFLGILYSVIFPYVFWTVKDKPSVIWYIIAAVLTGIWLSVEGILMLSNSYWLTYNLLIFMRLIGALASVCIFLFVLEYSINYKLELNQIIIFLIVPISLFLYVMISSHTYFDFVTITEEGFTDWSYNSIGFVHVVYLAILHIMAIGILLKELIVSKGINYRQNLLLMLGYTISVVPAFATSLTVLPPYINPSLFSLCFGLLIFGFGLKRYNLFNSNSVLESEVIDKLEDSIIVVDRDNNITDINESMKNILDIDIIQGDNINKLYNTRPEFDIDSGGTVNITISDEHYSLNKYEIDEKSILILRDITDLYDKNEKLDLIRKIQSRIFRHNLRNEMNIIRGNIEVINKEMSDERLQEVKSTVYDSVDRIENCSKKSSQINKVIESEGETVEQNLEKSVSKALKNLNQNYKLSDFDIQFDIDSTLYVNSHKMLPIAIENIIENSITHNSDSVSINVYTEEDEDNVRLIIRDYGEGIPETEINSIVNDVVLPLEHASSAGLWLVKWIVEKGSNGEILVQNTGDGTKVEFIFDK